MNRVVLVLVAVSMVCALVAGCATDLVRNERQSQSAPEAISQ